MLPVLGQAAVADVDAGAEYVYGASAAWWVHHGDSGTYYFVDVYSSYSSGPGRVDRQGAHLGEISCTVNAKGHPKECDFRHAKFDRVKVVRFSTDLTLGSAHAILRRGSSKADLTWTGKGNYSQPFLFQNVSEYMFGPEFAGVFANATVIEARRAPVEGRVFDLGLTRKDRAGSSLATYVSAGGSACTETFFC
jgi:hypothetical protein